MSVSMIALLGMSPAVITEGVQYLSKVEEWRFKDLVVIHTSERAVLANLRFIEAALKVHYPHLRLHAVPLEFDDIGSEEDNFQVMKVASNAIIMERDEYRAEQIYLNIAGGRKIMSISLSLLGSILGVTNILHIIHPDVQTFNELQERHKSDIEMFLDVEDPLQYYRSKQEVFDRILFPDPEKLRILNIPVIPYPPDALSRLKRILKGLWFEEEFVEDYILEVYKSAGLITYDKYRTYPTELGERLLEVLQ